MKLPANPWQNLSPPQKIIFILASLCVVGLIALAALVLELRSRQQEALPQAASTPMQDCQPLTLVLGETTFQIQNLNRAADGSLSVPQDTSGIVYWVEGTKNNSVFVLSPASENLALVSKINLGSEATATWSDCASTTYRVLSHAPGSFDAAALPDQSQKGITVFFPIDLSGEGFVFGGETVAEQPAPSVTNTVPTTSVNPTIVLPTPEGGTVPTPDYSQIQAEIGVLDVLTSSDEETITINISIYNYGISAFTLSNNDISLTASGGTPLKMIRSEPSLPREIAAAATETFAFTFPRPSSSTATLNILTVVYDIEDY